MSNETETKNSLTISGNTAYDGFNEATATLLNTDKIYLGIKNPTGAAAIVVNERTGLNERTTEIIGQQCYSKSLKVYKKGIIPIDLETGANGGWFPGSKTYGISSTNDIMVYSAADLASDVVGTIMKQDLDQPDIG